MNRHLSTARAAMARMFGDHLEESSTGALVRTSDGREFLNCAGYGVFFLGARHPRVVDAVVEQIRRHPLSTRLLLEPASAAAAETLANACPPGLSKVHFVGSGAEATETAIKLARAHGARRLITTVNGYHGKTMGALSVTARELYQQPFQPLLPDVVHVPFGDAAALAEVLADDARSCLILEPVQGEGGVIVPPTGYLREVESLCRKHNTVLVMDEILTGLGRLGRWWGADGIRPDVLLVGKALSGGVVPVAAAVCTEEIYQPFDRDPFLHTSTFAAAPIAVAAARAAVEVIRDEALVPRAEAVGKWLREELRRSVDRHCPHLVPEVRGEGLLIGVELANAGLTGELLLALIDRRVLVNHSLNNSTVLRLTPPAVLSDGEVERIVDAFDESFAAIAARFR
ncbi:aminotransferase class III-fold pyridoxal phosphate-dependent enzyme [Allokutzneria sp. A3M-2-11 16]|uniref:aspartate aminotransferase family protein n=1 Tax=Allokutzneria sp. A3M-2-11 16 TaxID=2962043 RepID=UPI0020B70F02|nr:aminotransferase class III-fold pyridoxal phosphate-dependent enzyme [Allokutzneria sp. A3M-2-11 16]MCP3803318.1 aminotransferase class III-fold pyridoxal phosphate-dependent enzyme [Allokutzneria sp. A3M-2-11 16]